MTGVGGGGGSNTPEDWRLPDRPIQDAQQSRSPISAQPSLAAVVRLSQFEPNPTPTSFPICLFAPSLGPGERDTHGRVVKVEDPRGQVVKQRVRQGGFRSFGCRSDSHGGDGEEEDEDGEDERGESRSRGAQSARWSGHHAVRLVRRSLCRRATRWSGTGASEAVLMRDYGCCPITSDLQASPRALLLGEARLARRLARSFLLFFPHQHTRSVSPPPSSTRPESVMNTSQLHGFRSPFPHTMRVPLLGGGTNVQVRACRLTPI